jgi:RNA polymerase sigma-70 factor (ECF subfamily)
MPSSAEVLGLLALLLLTDARREARVGGDGELVLLQDQDRSCWNSALIAEGTRLIERALMMGSPGPYQLQAAIAAVHDVAATSESTDWLQIVGLYRELERRWPSPVVALNHAVAVAMVEGPASGLVRIEEIVALGDLASYPYLHAARADLLRRLGRNAEARGSYQQALELTANAAERRFLRQRLAEVGEASVE